MIAEVETVNEYRALLHGYGDCNTGYYLIHKCIDTQVVVIRNTESRIKRIAEWAESTYGEPVLDNLILMERENANINGLHVWFDDIDGRLEEITEYLIGVKPEREIMRHYIDLNIKTNRLSFDLNKAKRLIDDIQKTMQQH
jgi:Na+/phosphate symporter